MSLFYLFLIAAIQGLTEFLPISSSGHLALLPQLSGQYDQGLILDVAVHVGSLVAVVFYFWRDVKLALGGLARLLRGKVDTQGAFLAMCLVLSCIPVAIAGFFVHVFGLNEMLRSVAVIGWTMLGFGLVLYWADKTGACERMATSWTLKHAVFMGLAQVLALIPGTSRSGITITAARRLGYQRESAARLSMLMSIPAIIASGILLGADVAFAADWETARFGLIAAVFAFATAWVALAAMMRLLRRISFTPFVIYRVVLGAILLFVAYS